MKIRSLVIAASLALASGTAFANHCPKDMAEIDAALARKPNLSAADMEEVKKLRVDGEAQHKAGDHKGAVQSLDKAMKILGIEHKS